jgi:hypothetical protein
LSNQNVDERLEELLALQENWNSYRALPIDRTVAERVRRFFPLAERLGLSPWICPVSDGGLNVERAGIDDWSAEFSPNGTASVYFDGLSDSDALALVGLFAQLKALDAAAQGWRRETGSARSARARSEGCAQRK